MPRTLVYSLMAAVFLLFGCQSADHLSTTPADSRATIDNNQISEQTSAYSSSSITTQIPVPVQQSTESAISSPSPNEKPDPLPTPNLQVEPIDMIFAGDAMFDWSVKEAVAQHGPDFPFVHVKAEIEKADFAFINLETAVTLENDKDTNQIYNFKSNPESLIGLKNAGFDMVSVANNHSMDFLQNGFLDTLDNLDNAGLLYVGGGLNVKDAYSAKSINIKGKKVKFLAFSRFIPTGEWFAGVNKAGIAQAYDKKPVLDTIAKERKDADYVMVYIHWGIEMNNRPEQWQRDYARQMIDAGADTIVGSHVHVLQGFEYYKGKPIAYSIGNFLFPDYVSGPKADTGLLHLKLHDDLIEMSFHPFYIEKNQIVPKNEAYVNKQHKYLESISYGVTLDGPNVRIQEGLANR